MNVPDIDKAKQYIEDVASGKKLVGNLEKRAVLRHLNDLKNGHKRGLWFDEKAAAKALVFFSLLKHSKGKFAGKPFILSPWQAFIVYALFGWKNENGTRRFRYAYIEVARKNGKTTFAAAIALYMLILDGEQGAEIFTAATKRDQAKICFNEAKAMVSKSQSLKDHVTVYQHNMHIMKSLSKMESLSADSGKLDGLNPHCSIIDEYHAHPNADLYNVLKSAMGAREQPLQFTITTAGFNKNGPCFQMRKVCIDVLEGRKQDDTTFAMIFTLDKDDDWEDPEVWLKANPNYHEIDTMPKYLDGECTQAKNDPTQQVNFKTKNLNLWTDQSEVWIEDKTYMACGPVTPESIRERMERLRGRECYGGLDLASTTDLVSLNLWFPGDETEGTVDETLTFFWCPKMTAEERVKKDGVNYDIWINQGYIMETEGNVTDYDALRRFISGTYIEDAAVKYDNSCLMEVFDLRSIAYDSWNSSQLVINLDGDGVTMSPFRQGFASMSAPTKEYQKKILEKKVDHGSNPVMRWQIGNVEIQRDPAGNIKIDKAKSSEKVDGAVSNVMSLGEMMTMRGLNAPSIYEERGFRSV